jgi:hypothetical protein
MRNGEYMRKILMPAARLLATILLLVSIVMFGILVRIAIALAAGATLPTRAWLFPLIILGTGAMLMWLLTKRLLAMQLYLAAFALWLVTTGYYVIVSF